MAHGVMRRDSKGTHQLNKKKKMDKEDKKKD